MPASRFVNPSELSAPTGYTHVVESRGARTIHVSGQVAFDAAGQLVGEGDLEAQAHQVFRNLGAALAAVDATFADVVRLGIFMLDASQVATLRRVRADYLDAERLPASTLVQVARLVHPGLLLEIEATAVCD